MFVVDKEGKITVSLGGVCALGCKHCYITSKDFRHQPRLQVDYVVDEVARFEGLKCICVSGDTDPLLEPEANVLLMEKLASLYKTVPIMFTTRLVPSLPTYSLIASLAAECLRRHQLFIPCVSLVTFSYPNTIERQDRVPASSERIGLIHQFVSDSIPCIVALRPTFPFSIVPPEEVNQLVGAFPAGTTAVLGEVFLIDGSRQLPSRMNWIGFEEHILTSARMTFLDQPSSWDKCYLEQEVEFVRSACHQRCLPYFLRSMSALDYLHSHWDYEHGCIQHSKHIYELQDRISICP